MEIQSFEQKTVNTYGEDIRDTYSLILTDSHFEEKLKRFDQNLKLMFDQVRKKWTVLEWAYDGSRTWNVILVAEDDKKKPIPLGDWVFNKLFVYRKRYEEKVRMGSCQWFNNLLYDADWNRRKEENQASDENQAMIRDDITQWRKASKGLKNEPVADATAGYPK